MSPVRRIVLSALWVVLMSPSLSGQMIRREGELVLHAFTLKHRPATDAIQRVFPLLSKQGTVELQPATNTLVIRDTPSALSRIIPVLRAYDHPSRPLTLEIYIVRALRSPVSPPGPSDLPEPLVSRLRAMLPYDTYLVQAQARLSSREGEAVTYALGGEYEVSFRLGTIVDGQRVRLSGFRILRRTEERRAGSSLIHTNLNLPLEQTTSFGLARTETSTEALMVVLTLRQAGKRPLQRVR
ncbi:MAG TPA: hypothetical protein VN493_12710 [Thermoanaerobaculia bacterium]|nr:hypothetical protein [Thermoanaerobaculia bacterium]